MARLPTPFTDVAGLRFAHIDRGEPVCALAPGELALSASAGGCCVHLAAAAGHLVMVIPWERIPQDMQSMAACVEAGPCRLDGGAARLFANALRQAGQELGSIRRTAHEGLADALLSLLRGALLERAPPAQARGRRGLLFERAIAHLRLHFQDPDLSLDDVARALDCSKRYLHGVFRDLGRTPAQALLDLRMAHCSRGLRDPARQHVPLATLAIESGFRDPAHFGRLFRRCHGMTPRAWRRAQAINLDASW